MLWKQPAEDFQQKPSALGFGASLLGCGEGKEQSCSLLPEEKENTTKN